VRGRHIYKIGADFNFDRIDNFFPGNFAGVYTFTSYANFAQRLPFSFVQAFAGPNTPCPLTNPNIDEYAFFVQDSWRATDRLTLNYGLRYDLFDYAASGVTNPNAGLAALGIDTGKMNRDSNNFGPRFGLAYRLGPGDRMVLRGGYGAYFARATSIMTGTSMSNNGIQVQTFELRSGFPAYPGVLPAPPSGGGVTPNLFVMDPKYVNPVAHQWSLNLESQVGRNSSVTLGYLGVRGEHLSHTRDINLFPAVATAVYDAVGVRIDETPISPDKVVRALDLKRQGKAPRVGPTKLPLFRFPAPRAIESAFGEPAADIAERPFSS
jgi:hypothetical protein